MMFEAFVNAMDSFVHANDINPFLLVIAVGVILFDILFIIYTAVDAYQSKRGIVVVPHSREKVDIEESFAQKEQRAFIYRFFHGIGGPRFK